MFDFALIYSAKPIIADLKISCIDDSLLPLVCCVRLTSVNSMLIISEMPHIHHLRPFWREMRWNLLNVDTVREFPSSQMYTEFLRADWQLTHQRWQSNHKRNYSDPMEIHTSNERPSRKANRLRQIIISTQIHFTPLHLVSLIPLIFNAEQTRDSVPSRCRGRGGGTNSPKKEAARLHVRSSDYSWRTLYLMHSLISNSRRLRVRIIVAAWK